MQGTYVFVEASNGRATDTAHWISPTLRQSAAGCSMRFWYHMAGTGMGTLNIYIRPVGDPSSSPMTKFSPF